MERNRGNVQLIIDTTTKPPYEGACGIINSLIGKSLTDLNLNVTEYQVNRPPFSSLIPLEQARMISGLEGNRKPSIRIFTERGLDFFQPTSDPKIKNIVFFHGMAFNPSAFLQNTSINAFCANSKYLMNSLLALLLYPNDFLEYNFTDRGSPIVTHLPLVATGLNFPKGYPNAGAGIDIPDKLLKLITQDRFYLGHALRPNKIDPFSFAAILYHLNQIASKRRKGKHFRVVVFEEDFKSIAIATKEMPGNIDPSEHFIPIPLLKNTELIRLMKKSSFSLCYDLFPEPFGLYPLESVFSNSPVFTNGAGNLRTLLPTGSGITVLETSEMYFGPVEKKFNAFKCVAELIFEEVTTGRAKKSCKSGQLYMKREYSNANFSVRMKALLKTVENPNLIKKLSLPDLRFKLAPWVRNREKSTGRIISDYVHTELSNDWNELFDLVLSKRPSDLCKKTRRKIEEPMSQLFRRGILTLSTEFGDAVRFNK